MGSFGDFSKVSYQNNSPNSNHAKVEYPLAFEYKLRLIISISNVYSLLSTNSSNIIMTKK